MRAVVVIPARYASTRFLGKPLVEIQGKSLIRRTWERCALALPEEDIFVATDDDRIADHCTAFGAQVVMTGTDCLTGTDRVQQAAQQIEADIYLDVQGDEPLMNPDDIHTVLDAARQRPNSIVNAMCLIQEEADYRSPMIPKVVARPDGRLLYMSRAPIPSDKQFGFVRAMRQVCVMTFSKQALDAFASCTEKTPLESIEDLEVLRFLELGWDVHMVEVSTVSIAVDMPEDVAKVEKALALAGMA